MEKSHRPDASGHNILEGGRRTDQGHRFAVRSVFHRRDFVGNIALVSVADDDENPIEAGDNNLAVGDPFHR